MINVKKNWVQLAIWLFLFAFYFSIGNYFQPAKYAVFASIFGVLYLYAMYIMTIRFLYPRFWRKQIEYFIYSGLLIIVFTILILVFETYVVKPFGKFKNNDPPIIFPFIRVFTSLGFTFFVGTSLSLMKQTEKLKENEKLLIEEKLATELKLLKSQINPHFIFNALNNIYSLTYMNSENAPESVLKLSEMLRYVFYDCSKDRVPLVSEIRYIENFASFQQMKSDYVQNVSIQADNVSTNLEIAPMLFIPFIENAFKYSRIEEIESAFITISVRNNNGKLHFKSENSIPKNSRLLPGSGMGIRNVKHRLEIIYPYKHNLIITNNGENYIIDLTLEL